MSEPLFDFQMVKYFSPYLSSVPVGVRIRVSTLYKGMWDPGHSPKQDDLESRKLSLLRLFVIIPGYLSFQKFKVRFLKF